MTPADPDLWRRADAIFAEAVEVSAERREAFIARACAGDGALLSFVRELLAADQGADALLDAPAALLAVAAAAAASPSGAAPSLARDEADADAADPRIGRTVGRFRIVRRLGKGGMGIVYEAEQEEPRRRVALKLMRAGWAADALELRFFRRETQTLARLQHPGIAAIYEVGNTDEGQPFFAMELVRGVPLDAASDGDADRAGGIAGAASDVADLHRRLDVFLEVCDAIVYAHQRGVIHRDLKPSNILVAEDAFRADAPRGGAASTTHAARAQRVKVVDFGLARISDADVSMVASRTEPSALQGTLPYMSPEQTRGNPDEIDFRSDVYSLGVILYRLLAGVPPYRVRADALLEAVRIIREETPRKAGAIAPLLRGDIETIIAKALEKDPERRYQSVAALADDIRRYLTDQPILARPASATYQIRKLAARHRAAAVLLATLFAVLVVSTITMSVLYEGQRRERAKAIAEAEKAEAVNGFLREMLAAVDPKSALGREVTVREVVDVAAGRIDRELAAQPDVQAALRATMGSTYLSLGEYDAAEPLLVDALHVQRRLHGPAAPAVAATSADLQDLYSRQGDHAAAESLARAHLAEVTAESGPASLALASALTSVASALIYRSGYSAEGHAEAESLLLKSIAIRDRLGVTKDVVYAATLESLGNVQNASGKGAEGEASLTRALAIRRAVLSDDHPDIATNLHNIGTMYRQRGENARAEAFFVEALSKRRKVLGDRHTSVGTTLNSLAFVRTAQGKYSEAESTYREVIALYVETFGDGHANVARAKGNLAITLEVAGRFAEAEILYREAIESLRTNFGADHSTVAIALTNLAGPVQKQGRLDEAEALLRESLVLKLKTLGPDHESVSNTHLRLGNVLLDRGRAAEAGEALRESRRIFSKTMPEGHWRVSQIDCLLGAALCGEGRVAEGESLLVRGYAAVSRSGDASVAIKHGLAERVAVVYERTGRRALAIETRRLASAAADSAIER
ncbi:MAG: tetratricopeptide repeat protein [bacterium]